MFLIGPATLRTSYLCLDNNLRDNKLLVKGKKSFLYLPFCASQKVGSVNWYWTLRCSWQALSSSEQITTFLARGKVVESVFTLTTAGAMIKHHCSPDLESFFPFCKPVYFHREFASYFLGWFFKIVSIHISLPPATVQETQQCCVWSGKTWILLIMSLVT